ncbi:MAG: GAF domain-containing sensor histidine kinase [Dehalococcoidia bacterium]
MTTPSERLPTDRRTLEAVARGALHVTEGLDIQQALQRLVDVAREITGARYAACAVPGGSSFLHFVYSGLSAAEAARIGHWPEGKGLLGAMLTQRESLRLERLDEDPASSGFPPNHPHMTTFLGVPVIYRERNIGDIYLTDKENGEPFNAEDQRAVEILAAFAAVAITNSYQYLQVNEELERRRNELDETNKTLQALSNRILWMLESERRQLAQELHDGLGQALAAAIIAADAIGEGRDDAKTGAARLRSILGDAVTDVRRISHGLRPTILDELGLAAAIGEAAEQFDAGKRGLISFQTTGPSRRLPEPVETVVYRVAQEALTNAVRHSGATEIRVLLAFEPSSVRLTVSDNGIGMPALLARQGLGIAGMHERARLVGGSLTIDSSPGQGVEVALEAPVN